MEKLEIVERGQVTAKLKAKVLSTMSVTYLGDEMNKSLLAAASIALAVSLVSPLPSQAACSASQEWSIESAEAILVRDQQALNKENQALSKIDIKINDLRQKLRKKGLFVNSTQRELDRMIREQGQALRKVSDAQRRVDSSMRSVDTARLCRR